MTLLVEAQELDECNNNLSDEAVVLPPAPRSKASSNSSSPPPSSPSLPSSSSSPSPSSTASSDAVSTHTNRAKNSSFQILTKYFPDSLTCLSFCLQDSDGTPCKTVKQLAVRGSNAHRDNAERTPTNHRAQNHSMTTPTTSHKGSKVKS